MGKVNCSNQNKAAASIQGWVCVLMLATSSGFSSELAALDPSQDQLSYNDPVITKLKPERERGKGFRLEYVVDAPPDVFWRYKSHFDNDLLRKNKYITSHKLVSREQNLVITETEYSYKPGKTFNWQTTVLPGQSLLEYELLNPEKSGQKYHYGYIKLEPEGARTRVIHVAYFDFFGASFWVNYPFKGGMSDFLTYTALWEQQFVMEFEHQYQ